MRSVLQNLRSRILIIEPELVKVPQIQLQRLVHANLHELLQALVVFDLELNVRLLGDQELVGGELLFVQLKLLLESGHLIDHLFLGVLELFYDLGAPLLLLLNGKFEILTLRFQNLSELLLFEPQLLHLSLHRREFLGKSRFLSLNLTKKCPIKLLEARLILAALAILVPTSGPIRARANLRRVHVLAEGRGATQSHGLLLVIRMRRQDIIHGTAHLVLRIGHRVAALELPHILVRK